MGAQVTRSDPILLDLKSRNPYIGEDGNTLPAHQDLCFKSAYSNVAIEILSFVVMVLETKVFNTH